MRAAAIALVLAAPMAARAQTADPGPSATAPAQSAICADRPTKSNGACTVDAGHFQYEADLFNGTFQRLDGVTTDTYLLFNPTLKYGLTSKIDVEANLAPVEIVRTRDGSGAKTVTGIGDLYLKVKYEFLNTPGGVLQAALLPYVKAPTARAAIGNGAVEGGATLAINYKVNSLLTVTTDPEIDAFKDAVGDGRHVNTAQLISLGLSLPRNVTLYGELWGDWNFDPGGTIRQYSADAAISWGATNDLQLDGGLNVGLDRETPGIQVYVGISQRF